MKWGVCPRLLGALNRPRLPIRLGCGLSPPSTQKGPASPRLPALQPGPPAGAIFEATSPLARVTCDRVGPIILSVQAQAFCSRESGVQGSLKSGDQGAQPGAGTVTGPRGPQFPPHPSPWRDSAEPASCSRPHPGPGPFLRELTLQDRGQGPHASLSLSSPAVPKASKVGAANPAGARAAPEPRLCPLELGPRAALSAPHPTACPPVWLHWGTSPQPRAPPQPPWHLKSPSGQQPHLPQRCMAL